MRLVVCAKPVGGDMNPFDESALEAALSLENAEIILLSMGPQRAMNMLQKSARLGISRAVLLCDNAFAGSDTLATGYALCEAIKKLNPDYVFCGKQSVDGDTAQVGVILSQMLGFSLCTNLLNIGIKDEILTGRKRNGECDIPQKCVVTFERNLRLRFPSIFSTSKPIETWNASDLCLDTSRCGLKGSPTVVLKTYENDRGRRNCTYISMEELFDVVEKSLSKKRTSTQKPPCEHKLKEVWTVGDELKKIADKIAQNVVVIDKTDPETIAKRALEEKPKVILWAADEWGRENAPKVQAILKTGLCADCTDLDTDGQTLFMYRPAGEGKILAKIYCKTNPAMATVRLETQSAGNVIISAGKGICEDMEIFHNLSRVLNAQEAASRSLVDTGKAPYEQQVGLTGKVVSPDVYIACGISGAVQHVCAIEDSGTVIAVNPDKNADIFSYADYGIVDEFKNISNTKTYNNFLGGKLQ